MIKKRYLILMTIFIYIIITCSQFTFADYNYNKTLWTMNKENDSILLTYKNSCDTYLEALNEALLAVGGNEALQYVSNNMIDRNGDGTISIDDIQACGDGMEVGETRIFKYDDTENGSYLACTNITNSKTGRCQISVKREEDQKYIPIITIKDDNSLIGNIEAKKYTYRDTIKTINEELLTNIPLPEEDDKLKDGETVAFYNEKAENHKVYNITIKATQKTENIVGKTNTYIEYTYSASQVGLSIVPNTPTNNGEDLLENLDDYKPGNIGEEKLFKEKVGVILGILNIVGFIISVITIMIIGFKYMLGSVEDKASYKKVMIPWLIGAFLVFTVTTVPNVLYNIGTSLSNDTPKSNGTYKDYNDRPLVGPEIYFTDN